MIMLEPLFDGARAVLARC